MSIGTLEVLMGTCQVPIDTPFEIKFQIWIFVLENRMDFEKDFQIWFFNYKMNFKEKLQIWFILMKKQNEF